MRRKEIAALRSELTAWKEQASDRPGRVLHDMITEAETLIPRLDGLKRLNPTDEILQLHDELGNLIAVLADKCSRVPFLARLVWLMYEIRNSHQMRLHTPLHKGRDYFNIGYVSVAQGKIRLGIRLVALALIEDIYFWQDKTLEQVRESNAYQFLVMHGCDERIATLLKKRVEMYRESRRLLYHPEEILDVDFKLCELLYGVDGQTGLDTAFLEAKLDQASKETDPNKKGRLWEGIAHFLMSQVDGVSVVYRRKRTRTSDIDVLCRVESRGRGRHRAPRWSL